MDLVPIYMIGGIIVLLIGIVLLIQVKIKGKQFKFKNLTILFTGTGSIILLCGFMLMLFAHTNNTILITFIRSMPMATIVIISIFIIIRNNKKL